MAWKFDYLIVGAGLSGLVLAERLSTQLGKTCLVVDRRDHIGGNCYDEYDANGLLIHTYGPHYFRTNSPRIVEYLSNFTTWLPTRYRVSAYTGGRFWSFPINLRTFEQLIGRPSSEAEFKEYLQAKRVPIKMPRNSEDVIVSQVGHELFEKFFRGYTRKQWKKEARELDASVCGWIPIRTNYEDSYLTENFQALPAAGYTRLFERMVRSSPLIKVFLRTDYHELCEHIDYGHLVYTGPIDEYYDHVYGPLPYRSLRFERESYSPDQLKEREAISGRPGFWQPTLQVNYPDDGAFTRTVELKHATGQLCEATTIVREFPDDFGPGKIPYYPIPTPATQELYQRYASRARTESRVSFVGRLATYRYYNMDQIVGMALAEFDRLKAVTTRDLAA